MRFEISHALSFPRPAVAEALLDHDYQGSLENISPLRERKLLSQEEAPD